MTADGPWRRRAGRLRRAEPALVLLAAPALLLYERLETAALAAGLGWLAALWVLRRAVDGRWSMPLVVDAPVLALLATVPGAVLAAADPVLAAADPVPATSRAASLAFAVAVAYAVANAVPSARRAWRAAGWLLVGAAGLAAAGALGAEWPDKLPVVGDVAARLPRLLPLIPHAIFGRTAGTASSAVHPNQLAGLLVPFVPLAAACWLWPRASSDDRRRMPRRVRVLAALSLAAMLPVLVLAQSRGAWAALGAGLAWLAWQRYGIDRPATGGRGARARWIAAAAVAAVVVVGAIAAGRGSAPGSLDASARLALWRASAQLAVEHPLRGIGLHQFALRYGQDPAAGGYVYQGYAHAHNQLLQAALDYGLPGLAAVAGLYAALAVGYRRARRHTRGTPVDALVVGSAAGLMAHALHGLVDAVAIGAKPGFVVWALVGLLAGARACGRRWAEPGGAAPVQPVQPG